MSNGKYAFFIHPMDIEDVVKKYKIAKKVSPKVVASILKRRRPFILSDITGLKSSTGVRASGSFIAVPLLPWQFYELDEDYLLKKIGKACKVAEKSGAKIVGLGAYTAIPGNGGEKLAEMVDVAVTTGNTYTVVIAIEGVLKAVDLMEIPVSDSTLAILGATGSIGSACLVYLAPFFKRTIALSRSPDKLKKLKNKVQKIYNINVETSTDISDLKDADVVVAVTGAVKTLIDPEIIKSGAVICDVARPRDVSKNMVKKRDDVLVIDGGVVRAPGNLKCNFDIGLPDGVVLACMAETMILALEKRYENYTVGKNITLEKIKEIKDLADKHGFKLAGLRSFDKVLSTKKIEAILKAANQKKK